MKKLFTTVFLSSATIWTFAQCIPMGYDFGTVSYGIYPDTSVGLNTGILNTPYEQVMHIKVPVQASEIPAEFTPTIDPALLALTTVDYIKIDSINVIINGIQCPMSTLMGPEYALYCSSANCEFMGGDQNCFSVSGTPNQIGDFDLVILASGQATATVFGFPIPLEVPQFPITGYRIHVSLDAGITIEAPTLPAYIPTNGLVGYWPFNGNANDESGNGNHGTIINNQSGNVTFDYDRYNENAKCVNFTSNPNWNAQGPYISIINSTSLWLNFSYSIVLWVKVSSTCQTGEILNKGHDDIGFFSRIQNPLSGVAFGRAGGVIDYVTPVNTTNWMMLCFMRDGVSNVGKLYINGISVASGYINPPSSNAENIAIGGMPSGGTNGSYYPYQGLIDDIAIYNRALTPEEITALYNGTTDNNSGNNNNTATSTVPAGISYQAVARNAQGTALANTAVQVKFTLITDSLSGSTEYVETHSLSTNSLGLFATAFGTGTAVTGTWAGINWTQSNKYLKVELDAGSGLVDLGTQQLLSSPFAIRAQSAATIENGALPVYSNNAAAIAGGLTVGKLYRTATGELKVVY